MNLLDFIVTVDDALPLNVCEGIIAEYQDPEDWLTGSINYGKVDHSIRDCDTVLLSHEDTISYNPIVRKDIDQTLQGIVKQLIVHYNTKCPGSNVSQDSGYELLRYHEGGHFATHVDTSRNWLRVLSVIFMLNNTFEGGELSFWDGAYTLNLLPGQALIFPSSFQYPHAVLPVTKGKRYSIVTWLR